MTQLVVGIGAAALAAAIWMACRTTFAAPILQRRNYRGVDVPVGAGIVIVLTVVAVQALLAVADVLGRDASVPEQGAGWITLIVVLGFGILGLFDDLAAHGDDRGFKGHIGSMLRGRLTTGGIKLVGGGLVALIAVHAAGADDLAELAVGTALVALGANLGNLFDRAPGRCLKVCLIGGAVVVGGAGASGAESLLGVVAVLGAGFGLLAFDLDEQFMLGDTGSNVLGAALGIAVVLSTGLTGQVVALVLVLALNLASEKISFSKVIDGVAPLRWFDRLGRHTDA